MRVVFCGSGPFAIASLRAVLASSHELVGVITQPARPAGRGGKPRPTPVAEVAREAGLDVTECASINDEQMVARIRALEAAVTCVADFGQMIRKRARQATALGAFNLHASLLPELRGAAPINWAIIRGCRRTGVTTFSLVHRMDAGPIYLQAETDVRSDETAEQLRDRLAEMGAELVCETLDLLAEGRGRPRPQDDSQATTAPMLQKSDGVIDWRDDAAAIRNRIHGTWPWPGAQTRFVREGKGPVDVVIARAAVEDAPAAREPGRLDEDLCVAGGAGRLRIVEIRPAGRRLMTWCDFVNGYRVREGDGFVSIDT